MIDHKVCFFTDFKYRAAKNDRSMMPIVWAQVDQVGHAERIKKHHARATHFELVPEIEQADLCVLPDNWPRYVANKKVTLAKEFADIAAARGKLTLVWSGGDPEWIIPIENAILVQEGLHKSVNRRVAFAFERPGFVDDYVEKYQNGAWQPLPKTARPTVGFCGQAAGNVHSRVMFFLRNALTSLRYSLGVSAILPNFIGYPANLRAKTLNLLQCYPEIDANFIIRDRYKAGAASGIALSNEQSRLEFVENILNNIYTVCVRGGGNFSKRFYETLACGRIPVFVDTDCVLPYEEFINWDEHIVRVKKEDLSLIGDIVSQHHARMSASSLEEMQCSNSKLWLDQLSPSGYYSNFYRYIPLIALFKKGEPHVS